MRVGINGRTFSAKHPGGEVQSMINLFSKFIELYYDDFEFYIFGNREVSRHFPEECVVCDRLSYNSQLSGLVWEQTILRRLVDKYKVDVLICPSANCFFGKTGNNKLKIVTWIHDMNVFYGWVNPYYKWLCTLRYLNTVKTSDVIVTVSNFSKNEICKFLGISDRNIYVVYNGIDEFYLNNEISRDYDYPEDYILFVGSAIPRKNLERLILAYNLISDKIKEYLVIIGPKNKNIFDKVNIKCNNKKIIVKGFVSKDELKYAYMHAKLFVFPSLYEGFGIPPLEAMACGTPVVASNIASLSEILGNAAHYVNPYSIKSIANGILSILDNTTTYMEKISLGRKRAKKFNWVNSSHKVLEIIKNIGGV